LDGNIDQALVNVNTEIQDLSSRVDRRRGEFAALDINLDVALDQIAALERLTNAQDDALKALAERLDSMEGRLCHCAEKGKGREVEVESVPGILGSPIDLVNSSDGDGEESSDSYHTPPGGRPIPSTALTLVHAYSDISEERPGIGYQRLESSDEDAPVENEVPIPIWIPGESAEQSGLNQLLAVRGQRAFRSKGPPKSCYSPYPRVLQPIEIGRSCLGPCRRCKIGDRGSSLSSSGRGSSSSSSDRAVERLLR